MSQLRSLSSILALLVTIALVSACAPTPLNSTDGSTRLALAGFAVPKAANNAAQTAFAETEAGAGVSWSESYGPSGDQSRSVAGGLKADLVHFSFTPDISRLVDAGLIDESWDAGPHRGMLTDSVVVLVVREGNPKNIAGWDDLVREGVGVVTPNPGSSGAARWNILGAWQHVIAAGGSEADAEAFLTKLFENVKALPSSGRDATQAFSLDTGDVLISYENEAILARQNGEKIDYVVPDDTLLIENPAAVLKDADPKAAAFLEFARSPEGQAEYVSKGFRPLSSTEDFEIGEVEGANDPKNPFPTPSKLFTIDGDFGGWEAVNEKFFHEKDGIITKLQIKAGLS